jgi:RNA polymerase sigma-70 factor (ECF subfamily)
MASSADSPTVFAPTAAVAQAEMAEHSPHAPTFGEIYEAHFPFVWRTARRLRVPPSALDDVVQEVFVVIHRRLSERRDEGPIEGWIYGIVVNVTRAYRRTARKPGTPAVHLPANEEALNERTDPAPQPDESAARTEALDALDAIFATLDEEKLEVLILADVEQIPVPRIAEALGIKLNTAYARLRMARQAFNEAAARHQARDTWRLR